MTGICIESLRGILSKAKETEAILKLSTKKEIAAPVGLAMTYEYIARTILCVYGLTIFAGLL
jgi:hypothetical protein